MEGRKLKFEYYFDPAVMKVYFSQLDYNSTGLDIEKKDADGFVREGVTLYMSAEQAQQEQKVVDHPEDKKVEKSTIATSGENGVLKVDTWVATSKNSMDEMYNYMTKGNYEALNLMGNNGLIFPVKKDTPVTVRDIEGTLAKIVVIENGMKGYIPFELVVK